MDIGLYVNVGKKYNLIKRRVNLESGNNVASERQV